MPTFMLFVYLAILAIAVAWCARDAYVCWKMPCGDEYMLERRTYHMQMAFMAAAGLASLVTLLVWFASVPSLEPVSLLLAGTVIAMGLVFALTIHNMDTRGESVGIGRSQSAAYLIAVIAVFGAPLPLVLLAHIDTFDKVWAVVVPVMGVVVGCACMHILLQRMRHATLIQRS